MNNEDLVEINETEISFDWEDKKVPLTLYLGWHPFGDSDVAKFTSIKIDDIDVDLSSMRYLSTKNGIVVSLGIFNSNQTYVVKWECQAGYYSFRAVIGYYTYTNLDQTVRLETYPNIEFDEKWSGEGKISI